MLVLIVKCVLLWNKKLEMYGHLHILRISTLHSQQRRSLHISGRVPLSLSGQKNRYLGFFVLIFFQLMSVKLGIKNFHPYLSPHSIKFVSADKLTGSSVYVLTLLTCFFPKFCICVIFFIYLFTYFIFFYFISFLSTCLWLFCAVFTVV